MKYSVEIPNGWKMNLAMIKDPVEAYEAMTNVAKAADEDGYESIWMVDHFHTVPTPSQEVTFETWMSLAAGTRHATRPHWPDCDLQWLSPSRLARENGQHLRCPLTWSLEFRHWGGVVRAR